MAIYAGSNGVNRQVKKIPLGVGGVNRDCKEAWAGVNGVNRKVYASAPPLTAKYRTYIEAPEIGNRISVIWDTSGNSSLTGNLRQTSTVYYRSASITIDFPNTVTLSRAVTIRGTIICTAANTNVNLLFSARYLAISQGEGRWRSPVNDFIVTASGNETMFEGEDSSGMGGKLNALQLELQSRYTTSEGGVVRYFSIPLYRVIFGINGYEYTLDIPSGTPSGTNYQMSI